MISTGLKFDNLDMPTPSEVSFTNNKLWSENTGRGANCLLVGDIIGIKKTISFKWFGLTGEEVRSINNFISNQNKPFFTATLLDETFTEKSYTVYANDPTY